jgi:cytochrome c-type biogenesis protein CcmH
MKKIFLTFFFINIFLSSVSLADDKHAIDIYKKIRCLVCQGQSLHDSNSDFAKDLKKIIKEKLDNKETDQQIYNYLTSRYGDWILLDTPVKQSTLLLWFIPIIVLIVGIIILFKRTVFEKSKLS